MYYFLTKKIMQMAMIRSSAVGVALLLQIWLVAAFGTAAYGDYVFFVTLCSLVTIFSKGGLDILALKTAAIAKGHYVNELGLADLSTPWVWRGILFTSVCCLGLWGLHSVAALHFPTIPAVSWGWIYAASVGMVVFQILIATSRGVGHLALADMFDVIVRNGLMALVAMTLVAAHFVNTNSANASFAISFYLASLLFYLLHKRREDSVTQSAPQNYGIKAHFSFVLSGLLSYIFFQMDTLILATHVSAVELGAYNMACNLVRAVIFIPMIIVVIVQPRIAVAFENADIHSVTRIAALAIVLSFVAASICSALIWLLGAEVLAWIDPDFLAAKDAMLILSLAHIVNSILMIVSGIISMTNRFMDVAKAQCIGGIAALALYGALIPEHGQVGAALAMFAGLTIVVICYLFMYRRHLPKLYDFLLPKVK
jgi:O-antigen/teichoic acid export membrane protein